ncbi:hypothetical protein ILUMI_04657 [Ignelater luminosus]|uniref:Synembryn-A n=1 Tax=Ignelater luminosus TaxID=2038154 RepID=A0A8K0DDW6_IGNLU|nr:hypothetical protein ILUMI_04657 [Ignelater luminosus]
MSTEIEKIISGNQKEAGEALQVFLENNAKVFTFSELNKNDKRANLWKVLFDFIGNTEASHLHVSCLAAIRILSREKTGLNELLTEERIELLLQHACLTNNNVNQNAPKDYDVAAEALKCLCNIIYNSSVAVAICSKNKCIAGIMDRTKQYKDPKLPMDIKIFDMKILFLITALCSEVRPRLKEELHGLKYLIEILEYMIPNCDQDKNEHNSDIDGYSNKSLSDSQIDLMCEILKVLFNLTVHTDKRSDIDEEEEAYYMHLVTVLRNLLVSETQDPNKRLELHNHIINLLTNMPNSCYKELIVPLKENSNIPKNLQYEEQNMEAIYQLFLFLKTRFTNDVTIKNQQDLLSPVLTVLLKGVNSSRIIRKYLRLNILPPLRDVHNRPEQGSTLRNHLCRLLTTPMTNVRDLIADLLFILCKENVGRMIKYTGYGNAAGLFAQRGLLGGGRPGEGLYSSDSENSDTEEYREHKHGINPVIGCYEPPHPSPFENMTEEQKEYEAMKLVNLMDDLTRKGIVQPCRIGEDGRPQPIEHVLQLQESLPQQIRRNISQDDSDG